MDIFKKIEDIRRQPEHIRLRWVWGLTASFMIGIILLWIILLKSQKIEFPENLSPENASFSTEFNQQKKSIKDAIGQLKDTASTANTTNTTNLDTDQPANQSSN